MLCEAKAEGLDALVCEYLQSEGLVEGCTGEMNSQKDLHDACEVSRKLLCSGDVLKAIEGAKRVSAGVMEDQRLLFRLQKQHFIELLRRGDKPAALDFCRKELAPCSHIAYPEAYSEFKKVMLALVYPEEAPGPVAEEWSMSARESLAGLLYQTLRQQRGMKDPTLVILLTYLVHISSRCYSASDDGEPQPEENLLLIEEPMDEQPLPKLDGRASFPESDVQSLAQAVGISRQSSIAALKHTDGALSAAFWNELGRRRVNRAALNAHVYEYACYRGLLRGSGLEADEGKAGGGGRGGAAKRGKDSLGGADVRQSDGRGEAGQPPHKRSRSCSPRSTEGDRGEGDGTAAARDGRGEGSQATTGMDQAMDIDDGRGRAAPGGGSSDGGGEGGRNGGPPSTAGRAPLVWRGPPPPRPPDDRSGSPAPMLEGDDEGEEGGGGDDAMEGGDGEQGGGGREGEGGGASPSRPGGGSNPKPPPCTVGHEDALRLLTLASEGLTERVAEGVQRLEPDFFRENPRVLFELKRCEFARLLEQGRPAEALAIARKDLGPLTLGCPQLFRALKDTLVSIAAPPAAEGGGAAGGEGVAGAGGAAAGAGGAGSAALQAALVSSLGLEEPVLLRLLRRLLGRHTRWFRLQRCEDPHRTASGVSAVKGPVIPGTSHLGGSAEPDGARSEEERDSEEGRESGEGDSDEEGDEDEEDEEGDVVFTETGILTLMEFLAVSRADAIQLLQQYSGSPELALAHIIQ